MKIESHYVPNGAVRLHVLDANPQSTLTPFVICPGLSETAEDYTDLMAYLAPRRVIALSFRGRGQSDTPETGYKLEDHVSDLACVIEALQLGRIHLYAYSRGVSYALGYMRANMSRIVTAALQEYPAEHKRMPELWAESYVNDYLIPISRQLHIRPEAVIGIQRESEQVNFRFLIPRKLLLMNGTLEDRLLDEEGVRIYRGLCSDLTVRTFARSGHDIRSTEKELLYRTIHEFIRDA